MSATTNNNVDQEMIEEVQEETKKQQSLGDLLIMVKSAQN